MRKLCEGVWGDGYLKDVLEAVWMKFLAWRFRPQRGDYYRYLADLIDGTNGTKTLFHIFQDDARRIGHRNCRGALSELWLRRYPLSGGDLFVTWFGSFPLDDLIAVQNAQHMGAHALVATFRKLADVSSLLDRAKSTFLQTALVGFAAVLVAVGALMAIPLYTADHLAKVFSAVPQSCLVLGRMRCSHARHCCVHCGFLCCCCCYRLSVP